MMLEIVPQTIKEAKRFVRAHHRTHRPPQGGLFALGVADDGRLCGVAIVGRPISRVRQANEPFTVELTRCATDGTEHANSKLYRAAWSAARALGWRRLITKTLPDESGASPKAAGYRNLGVVPGGKWHRESRPRLDDHPTGDKVLWDMDASIVNGKRAA
jgi:hypothetical protein